MPYTAYLYGLACLHPKAHKVLYLCSLEKTSGLASAPGHNAPRACSSGRRRSLTTHALLWTPRRPPLRQWDLIEREKPHQHAAGLLLLNDTAQCPVQPSNMNGGMDARHGARVQSPRYALSCARDNNVLCILLVDRASGMCLLAVSATSLPLHREGFPSRRVRRPCWTDSAGRRMVVARVSTMPSFASVKAGRP
jgi:hypothetical protein